MESSIANLFDQYFPAVYKYVFFRVRNQLDAEDIVADVFEKVLKKHHTFQSQAGATIRSWIFAIARNTLIDYYRTQHRQPGLLDDVVSSAEIAHHDRVENHVDTAIDLQRVYIVLDKLPPRQQEIVLLRYQSDLSNTEIAALLEIDQRTVSSVLATALKTLRTHFQQQHL